MARNNYEPQIVGVTGAFAGVAFPVYPQGVLIGRDTLSCQIVIPANQINVSRTHCFVTFNPVSGMFVINDRNSSGGTFLENGMRVRYGQPTAIHSGERFYLTNTSNMFEVR